MKTEREKREIELNKKELAAHKKHREFNQEEFLGDIEKQMKEKNITDPGDRLNYRADAANEYRKKHGGKLPGGWLESDQ